MFRTLNLSTKLLLTILPLVFLAIGVSVFLNNLYQEQEMLRQARASAETTSDLIRESLVNMMVTRQRVDDDYLVRLQMVSDIRDLSIQFTVDNLHLIDLYLSEERMQRLRKREERTVPSTPEEREVFQTGEPIMRRQGNLFNALIPFKATPTCRKCHEVPVGHVLGAAHMNISLERTSASIRNNWIRSFAVFLAFTGIAIGLSILLYRSLVAKRMKALLEITKQIGTGNLDHPVYADPSRDELGELASAFDSMRVRLKKAQAELIQRDRLSTIGQMASSIIHDFRSPMSTINLAVQSLQQGKGFTPEKTAHWYQLIREAISRMVTMAQELLDFSRGETRLDKQELPIDDFVEQIIRSVKTSLEQAKVELHLDQQCSGSALFDADRLHRALINIINNAQDAMPQGGTLRIVTTRDNGAISFSIADTGVGIPPEIRDKIFDPFVTAGKKKGTGLGLAITKRIVDQHGGTIEVQSERGTGTTFTVKIPA